MTPSPDTRLSIAAVVADVVDTLCSSQDGLSRRLGERPCRQMLPSPDELVEIVEGLRSVVFPGYFGTSDLTDETMRFHVGSTLDRVVHRLEEQVKRGLCFACQYDPKRLPRCDQNAAEVTLQFVRCLPRVRALLASDVQAAFDGDPAASTPDEAIFAYPGVRAITNYRVAHELYRLGVPLIPRIITEHAHGMTGIDIHPGATIGGSFFIDHGTGVVIGETCEIGERVRLYQGVTLGAKSFPVDANGNPVKGMPRHPIVEDDVVVYAGATILGRVRIGRGSIIGGNVWLTKAVPPGSRVTQAQVDHDRFELGGGI